MSIENAPTSEKLPPRRLTAAGAEALAECLRRTLKPTTLVKSPEYGRGIYRLTQHEIDDIFGKEDDGS